MGQKRIWIVMGMFTGVMLLRGSTQGIWAAALLLVGGAIVVAAGFLSSNEAR